MKNHRFKQIILLSTVYFLLSTVYIFGGEEIEYTAQDLRDPFDSALPEEALERPTGIIPISEAPISLPSLKIEALVWGTPQPRVIINGKVLKIGDIIEDAKIINISKEGIDIAYEGKLFSLPSPGKESLRKKEEGK